MGVRSKIIILDAARGNPFGARFHVAREGLAAGIGTVGMLVLYSTAPGMLLNESTAANSVFATELVKHLRIPHLTVEEMFNRTRIAVSRASSGKQVPLVASSLPEELYLSPNQQSGGQRQAESPTSPPVPTASSTHLTRPSSPSARAQASREPGHAFRDCSDCPELVVVAGGTFDMGSSTEYQKPIHRVSIPGPLAVGRHEVTFEQWDICVQEQGCKRHPDDRGWGRGTKPVINVSWVDAKEYVGWLSRKTGQVYRLPSESEWEYASRAGTNTPYWWGNNVGTRKANCRECGTGQPENPMPVGSFEPNQFGLFETSGNAAEWVEDCWNDSYRGAPSDGSAWLKGDCQLRVLRGGSYASQGAQVQSSARFRYDSDVPYSANGFRVARELR